MPEIVGTFARAETRDEGANSSTQRWDGSGGDLVQERLGWRSREPHQQAEHMAAPTAAARVKKALANPEHT